LQLLRKSPRQSNSASVSSSFWAKVLTGSLRASSITVYNTTLDWLAIEEGNAFEADVVRGKFARMRCRRMMVPGEYLDKE
jgi:hypothetical protein